MGVILVDVDHNPTTRSADPGDRLICVAFSRSGGASCTVTPNTGGTWVERASRYTLPDDSSNRRAVSIFEMVVESTIASVIFTAQMRDSGANNVNTGAIWLLIEEGSDYLFSSSSGADNGVNAGTSQGTGNTASIPAGDHLIIAAASSRGGTTVAPTFATTDITPPLVGGGDANMQNMAGGGATANSAAVGYANLAGQSAQARSDTITLDTARLISAAIAVWVKPSDLTLIDYADAPFESGNPRVTSDLNWNESGDVIVSLGVTEDNGVTLGTPTMTGVTLSALANFPSNTTNSCKVYGWSGTASADGNDVVDYTLPGNSGATAIGVWSFSNCSGLGTPVVPTPSASAVVGMTVQEGSSVVMVLGDWNATSDVTVDTTPVGGTVRRAQNAVGAATAVIVEWHDQPAGTRDYGLTNWTGTGTISRAAVEVLAPAGGATDVTPDDSTHAQAADSPTLTQLHQLVALDAIHGQTAESPALTQVHVIAVDSATHAQTATSPDVDTVHVLAPNDAVHAQTAEAPTITQLHVVAVADAVHAQTSDSPTLVQTHDLTANDATHAQTAEQPTLDQAQVVEPDDATHAQTVDSPTLIQTHALEPADSTHAQTAESPAVVQTHHIEPADATHGQTAEQPDLLINDAIAVQSANHAQIAESPGLTQLHILSPSDATHAQIADSPSLGVAHTLDADDATHGQTADQPHIDGAEFINPDSANHSQTVSQPALTQLHIILVHSALHTQFSGSPLLNAPFLLPYVVIAVLDDFDGGPSSATLPNYGPASATLPIHE